MKKVTQIHYNPYTSEMDFKVLSSISNKWDDIKESDLNDYANKKVLFSNCVNNIVKIIDNEQNTTSEGLEIQFIGSKVDFILLKKVASKLSPNAAGGKLSCTHLKEYQSADETLLQIKECYEAISSEFSDYMPGKSKYVDEGVQIGDSINQFQEITSKAIPICVIGTYSVGKSALINAFIGDEILPSKEDPSTAKNVRVVRSTNEYWIEFVYGKNESEKTTMRFLVDNEKLKLIYANGPEQDVAQAIGNNIAETVDLSGKNNGRIIHDILEYFNGSNSSDVLKHIQHNVSVGVPFADSMLTKTNEEIVFYDTPGSNNSDVDQKAHKQALTELMEEQTNALPILVTTRDSIMADDVAEIKQLLDDYFENFACTNCLIVCSKCDELVSTQLGQNIKQQIKDWHGGTSILFSTPIGAIGERKVNKSEWLDNDYRKLYKRWKKNIENDEERTVLPEYNVIACADREKIYDEETFSDLYATGIPSIELEILYYINNFANYRKCVRGKKALQKAIDSVNKALENETQKTNEAIEEAAREKEKRRQELINELKSIHVADITKEEDKIEADYDDIVKTYLSGIIDTMNSSYDKLSDKSSFEMDKEFNTIIKDHCQKELIDKNYYGDNGIQKRILRILNNASNDFIDKLKCFVKNNETSLSKDGRDALKLYIEKEIQPPTYTEVKSVIDDLFEFFEKAALLPHIVNKKMFKDENKAKSNWVESKRKSFEKELVTSKNKITGKPKYGIFRITAINTPIKKYNKEINKWSEEYKEHIIDQLNESNDILSGLEDKITELKATVDDLTIRIENVKQVSETVYHFLELTDCH